VAEIVFSEEAFADLERILEFLLQTSSEHASEAFHDIRIAVDVLGKHPLVGGRIESRIRELVISWGNAGYLALYRFAPALDVVRILRIRHQREAGYMD
jgi:plasmid stabilization system protein ParE